MIGDMMYAGAVYEARTHGSVRGMGRKPHPTRLVQDIGCRFLDMEMSPFSW